MTNYEYYKRTTTLLRLESLTLPEPTVAFFFFYMQVLNTTAL